MKKLIFIFLMVAGVTKAQEIKPFEWLDSLNSTRTAFTVNVKNAVHVTADFRALGSNDSVTVSNLIDSAKGWNATKFLRDTIPQAMINMTTNADYTGGLIKSIASPLEMLMANPVLNKLLFKTGDTALDHTIYIRIRGYTYY